MKFHTHSYDYGLRLIVPTRAGLWWSKDTEGHGGSVWKVMEQTGNQLIHKADADEYGDFIEGKHKGNTGKVMDMKSMKCRDNT